MLYNLIQSNQSKITVVVRGENEKEAFDRMSHKYANYFDATLIQSERLNIINGDLSLPNFGLEASKYSDLTNSVDCIINAAANIKHYGKLEDFYEVNTKPIHKIIDFSLEGTTKPIHHISTLSVSGFTDVDLNENEDFEIIFKENETYKNQQHFNAYTQSKYEADFMLDQARKKGVQVNIYRVGNLSFNSETGGFQDNIENNAFYNQIKSYLAFGAIPNEDQGGMEISCIDKVSEAIVRLMNTKGLLNRNFHVRNEYNLRHKTFVKTAIKNGFPMKTLEPKPFLENILDQYDSKTQLINRFLLHSRVFDEETSQVTPFYTCSEETDYILSKLGFKWNKIKDEQIKLMLDYGRKINFWN